MLIFRAMLVVCSLGVAIHAAVAAPSAGWEAVPALVEEIQTPNIPNREFLITEYNAAGGGADSKPAFDRAIAACHAAGGGRVVIPAGDWFVKGPLHLRSNVELHLQQGATLRFSNEPADYLPVVFTRFEGTEVLNYSPLIYAVDQQNVAVTGKGTLDGQAGPENWWKWKGSGNADIAELVAVAERGVPPEERRFGEGRQLRPNFIQFYRCKNVLIEGVTIVGSPMWVVHPCLCTNVTVRGVTVNSHGPNNDGCNPESCNNVLIEECLFDTGDDCIAIKSGRNADGRRLAAPSENVIVRRCTMKDGHGGVTLGSEMSGGVRNVYVEDCAMSSPNLERGIRLKSNSRRGGYLENLFVRNVRIGEVEEAALHIDLLYFKEVGDFPPTVRNIRLENVSSEKSKWPLFLVGLQEAPIHGVELINCTFAGADEPSVLEHVDDLVFKNVAQPRE